MQRLLTWCGTFAAIATLVSAVIAAEPARMPKRAWGPEQATGAPDTPEAGDEMTAWASASQDGGDEWLELEYAAPVLAESVLIHETYNPGAVFKVMGYTASGMEAELWKGKDPTPVGAEKGVSEIDLKGKLETKRIRIYLKSKEVAGWNEIDAVGLKDAKGKVHWAVAATASSTYAAVGGVAVGPFGGVLGGFVAPPPAPVAPAPVGPARVAVGERKRSWGPEQVTGKPDTEMAGDYSTAWASGTPDGADEWLELEYAEAIKIESVKIYESYNPGAAYKVTGFGDKDKEEVLWEGKDPTAADKEMGTSEIPIKGMLKTKKIRVYIKSTEFPGYNEIDAVSIQDAAGKVQWAEKVRASSTYADGFGRGGVVDVEDEPRPVPAPVVRPRAVIGPRPAVAPRPAVGDPRIDKLEKEVSDLKKSIEEIRKLLEKKK